MPPRSLSERWKLIDSIISRHHLNNFDVFVFVICSMMNFIRVFEWILSSRGSIGNRVKKIVFYEFLELLEI